MKRKIYMSGTSGSFLKNLRLMRRLNSILIILVTFFSYSFSQNDSVNIDKNNKEISTNKETVIEQDTSEVEKIPLDTNIIELGNKLFIFIEYENGMVIDRIDTKTGEKKRILDLDCKDCDKKKDKDKFRGHWSGFEFGINEFTNSDFSFKRSSGP